MALSLGLAALPAANATAVAVAEPSKLEKQVQEWVSRLSEQPPFREWQGADPQIEALGPGTHGWLVLFTKEGKHIGYMVVHAVTDGSFRLGEYGFGPFPLFSGQVLKRSLVDGGWISEDRAEPIVAVKRYAHPFAAAWEVSIGSRAYWFDGKTAEQLPLDGKGWAERFPDSRETPAADDHDEKETRIESLRLNETFDAYERLPWLENEKSFPADERPLRKRLDDGKHLRYVTEPFGDTMLYAVPVIGYQRWTNGRLDIALDMQGTRFVPLDALTEIGLFYR